MKHNKLLLLGTRQCRIQLETTALFTSSYLDYSDIGKYSNHTISFTMEDNEELYKKGFEKLFRLIKTTDKDIKISVINLIMEYTAIFITHRFLRVYDDLNDDDIEIEISTMVSTFVHEIDNILSDSNIKSDLTVYEDETLYDIFYEFLSAYTAPDILYELQTDLCNELHAYNITIETLKTIIPKQSSYLFDKGILIITAILVYHI